MDCVCCVFVFVQCACESSVCVSVVRVCVRGCEFDADRAVVTG